MSIPTPQDFWHIVLRVLAWPARIPIALMIIFKSGCLGFLGPVFFYKLTKGLEKTGLIQLSLQLHLIFQKAIYFILIPYYVNSYENSPASTLLGIPCFECTKHGFYKEITSLIMPVPLKYLRSPT